MSKSKQAALKVISILHNAGFQALLAGGCVRDMLMNAEPHDYDVATNARPEQVGKLFKKTLKVGAQFGVMVVLLEKSQIEVATFRSETGYADGRRPDKVEFTDAREDALRRDFTINGMFYDPIAEEVLDYVGGKEDLQSKTIRAIGDPAARFGEDHLRMLRAIRFAARFNYTIEDNTWQAICSYCKKIEKISAERIATELEKIITHPNRHLGITLTADSGLLKNIFPQCPESIFTDGIALLDVSPKEIDFALALSLLLAAADTDQINNICRDLKLSNDVRKKTQWILTNFPELTSQLPLTKGNLKLWLANEYFNDLLQFATLRSNQLKHPLDKIDQLKQQIIELGDEEITPEPILNGNDLIQLGTEPGPRLGKLFNQLYLAQLEGQITNRHEAETIYHQLTK